METYLVDARGAAQTRVAFKPGDARLADLSWRVVADVDDCQAATTATGRQQQQQQPSEDRG